MESAWPDDIAGAEAKHRAHTPLRNLIETFCFDTSAHYLHIAAKKFQHMTRQMQLLLWNKLRLHKQR
jgi:hypothetical protein